MLAVSDHPSAMPVEPASRPVPPSSTRRRSDRGATIVEFSIAFPILILLLLAIVDFGVNYGNKINVSHSAREAARLGSVGQTGGDGSCSVTAMSSPSTAQRELICFAKRTAAMKDTEVRVRFAYMGPGGKIATTNTGLGNKNSMMMCVQGQARSVSGLFSPLIDDKVFTARTVIKTGRLGGTSAWVDPISEVSLPTGNWGFCTADDPIGTE